MAKIGFIGLGNMGGPMAVNLIGAGHEVIGFDRAPAALDALRAAGGSAADSAAACASAAEAVITMLPAGAHVREVWLGADGLVPTLANRGGSPPLLIDSSTIDVETAREVAAAASAAGIDAVDAPVSGGVGGAKAGTLTFMVGGPDAAFARAQPLLAAMGRRIIHAGGPGAGQAAKICNNMILGISMLAVSEAFVLAERLGLDRAETLRHRHDLVGRLLVADQLLPRAGSGSVRTLQPQLRRRVRHRAHAEGPRPVAGRRRSHRRRHPTRRPRRRALPRAGGGRRGRARFFRGLRVAAGTTARNNLAVDPSRHSWLV